MNDTFDTPCLCLARDARQYEPELYQWCGGILWGVWAECPAHVGDRHMAPVWTREHGQLVVDETETLDVVSAPI